MLIYEQGYGMLHVTITRGRALLVVFIETSMDPPAKFHVIVNTNLPYIDHLSWNYEETGIVDTTYGWKALELVKEDL